MKRFLWGLAIAMMWPAAAMTAETITIETEAIAANNGTEVACTIPSGVKLVKLSSREEEKFRVAWTAGETGDATPDVNDLYVHVPATNRYIIQSGDLSGLVFYLLSDDSTTDIIEVELWYRDTFSVTAMTCE